MSGTTLVSSGPIVGRPRRGANPKTLAGLGGGGGAREGLAPLGQRGRPEAREELAALGQGQARRGPPVRQQEAVQGVVAPAEAQQDERPVERRLVDAVVLADRLREVVVGLPEGALLGELEGHLVVQDRHERDGPVVGAY